MTLKTGSSGQESMGKEQDCSVNSPSSLSLPLTPTLPGTWTAWARVCSTPMLSAMPTLCCPLTDVEWMPIHMRAYVGTLIGYSYSLGQFVLAGLAYAAPHWRHLQLLVSAPFYAFFLYSWCGPGKWCCGTRGRQGISRLSRPPVLHTQRSPKPVVHTLQSPAHQAQS